MVQKRGEVENILKVSFPGPILVRKGSGNDVFLTRSRDEIVLDIEKRDVKPLYWDQVTAHFSDHLSVNKCYFPVKKKIAKLG